jgi:hypothetical protein
MCTVSDLCSHGIHLHLNFVVLRCQKLLSLVCVKLTCVSWWPEGSMKILLERKSVKLSLITKNMVVTNEIIYFGMNLIFSQNCRHVDKVDKKPLLKQTIKVFFSLVFRSVIPKNFSVVNIKMGRIITCNVC